MNVFFVSHVVSSTFPVLSMSTLIPEPPSPPWWDVYTVELVNTVSPEQTAHEKLL